MSQDMAILLLKNKQKMFRLQIKCKIYSCDINIAENKVEKFLSSLKKEIIRYKQIRDINPERFPFTVLISKL